MNLSDISNYVRQTPGNTNPSIIQSMVKEYAGANSTNNIKNEGGMGYTETLKKTIFKLQTQNFNELSAWDNYWLNVALEDNFSKEDLARIKKIEVMWDGTKYDCYFNVLDGGEIVVGDPYSPQNSLGLPFGMELSGNYNYVIAKEEGNHTFSAIAELEIIHLIDSKYLPKIEIDLADFGVDVFGYFLENEHGGTIEYLSDDLYEFVNIDDNKNKEYILVIREIGGDHKVKTPATKLLYEDQVVGLTARFPSYYYGTYYDTSITLLLALNKFRLINNEVPLEED